MLCVQPAAPSLPLPASNLTGSKSNKEHLRRTLPLWIERTMGVLNSFMLWVYYISAQCQFNHYRASHNVMMKYTFKGPHELRVSARMVYVAPWQVECYWKQVDGQTGIILCWLFVKERSLSMTLLVRNITLQLLYTSWLDLDIIVNTQLISKFNDDVVCIISCLTPPKPTTKRCWPTVTDIVALTSPA